MRLYVVGAYVHSNIIACVYMGKNLDSLDRVVLARRCAKWCFPVTRCRFSVEI